MHTSSRKKANILSIFLARKKSIMSKRRKSYLTTRDPVTGKRVLAHRWLAEQALGRSLRPEEVVHHRDGDSLNNDPENLIVLPHQRFHAHAEFHGRRQRTGMTSLFPEYFQGIPESRGSLFDHVFVLTVNAAPVPLRATNGSSEHASPELGADPLFPELIGPSAPRQFALSIRQDETGAQTLEELLGSLEVRVTQGGVRETAKLRDFFPDQGN